MKVASRARWYIRIFQFSPIVAALLLAAVWLAVPVGLRAQIDSSREYRAIADATGFDTGVGYSERELAEQWFAARHLQDHPQTAGEVDVSLSAERPWQDIQIFFALRQAPLLGGASLLLAMAIVASPAAFIVERHRITQALVLEEMGRVQQDAHDKVYNRLSALSKRVEIASESTSSEVARSLDGVAEDIRDTVTDLQDILGDARQRTASLTGKDPLRSQLESVAREQAARLSVTVDLTVIDEMPPLSAQTGWDLQCVLEEAISNAVEHGEATHVSAMVDVEDDTLRLRVTDNGSGMPDDMPDELPDEAMGLRGMHNRAERHGGTFSTTSTSAGTTVEVRIPVRGNRGE